MQKGYCPDDHVTRGQMAAYLTRAPAQPASDDDYFVGDDAINALAASGITCRCSPPDNTRFCPDADLSRAEMATFLAPALSL